MGGGGGGKGGGANSRYFVISTSCATKFLINQSQITTFLNLKSDIIENSRIELRGIVLPAPSNQSYILLLFYPSTWYICDFFPFHIEIEGKDGWLIGGEGGGKGYIGPPLKFRPLPSSYAYVSRRKGPFFLAISAMLPVSLDAFVKFQP